MESEPTSETQLTEDPQPSAADSLPTKEAQPDTDSQPSPSAEPAGTESKSTVEPEAQTSAPLDEDSDDKMECQSEETVSHHHQSMVQDMSLSETEDNFEKKDFTRHLEVGVA